MASEDTFGANESAPERAFDYDRTVALSDGVFAIALTLLVLSLTTPILKAGHTSQLGSKLVRQHDEFVLLFRTFTRIDMRVTGLNLAYLAFVAFLPFPTRVLAVYGEEPTAVALYAATGAVISLLAGLIRRHMLRAGLVHPSRVHELGDREHWIFTPAVFIASIPIAYANPSVAKFFWLLLAAQNATERWFRKRSSPPADPA